MCGQCSNKKGENLCSRRKCRKKTTIIYQESWRT